MLPRSKFLMSRSALVRTSLLVGLLLLSLSQLSLAGAKNSAGVNHLPNFAGSAIDSITTPNQSSSGQPFPITLRLGKDSDVQNVSVEWTWYSCTNVGVCRAPTVRNMTPNLNATVWLDEVIPPAANAYVAFRVTLNWSNGTVQNFPESGFEGQVWSDCYIWEGATNGQDCPTDEEVLNGRVTAEKSNWTPSIGIVGLLSVCLLASRLVRRPLN
uniref:Uncharacterized protein n=1 Tax=uncultured marine group II/III euryarchaeote KM3_80_G12 TaxID=1456515 RepID=A0A075HUG3_9EURY|nr:hypothetical protein [uncultured marine group II/III euryarchaeote KM3_80_G12]